MRINKRRQLVGSVVRIDLGDGFHSYARALEEGLFAFYDSRTQEDLLLDEIVSRPVLFIVPVMGYAVSRGHWTVIGSAPLDPALLNPPPRFMQDALNLKAFSLYEKGKIRPATMEECIGLECEAVWDPSHVEDRIRDHYLGRANKWVESLRIKSPPGKTTQDSPERTLN
jgi:hypothetical protein